MERCQLTFSGALPSSLFPGSVFGVSCLVGRCVVCLGLCMNVDAVFVVIDCCYRLYDRFVVKLHACLPEKIDSYLISYLILSYLWIIPRLLLFTELRKMPPLMRYDRCREVGP